MGRLDVDAMLTEMTATELAEWQAFYSLEPWGTDVGDLRAGVIAAAVANHAGKVLREGEVRTPADFFPTLDPQGKRASRKRSAAAEKSKAWFAARAKPRGKGH